MLNLKVRTNINTESIRVPESWYEVTVDKYIRIVKEWDREDWIQLFCILTDQKYDSIAESKDYKLEATLYRCIEFALDKSFVFEDLEVPKFLLINNRQVEIPRKIGRLSIGQAIQARKSLEGINDLREGISIVTAIYLQPLIHKGKFDHLRAIEIEQEILRYNIVNIFPIGFFLLRKLNSNGNWWTNVLLRIRHYLHTKGVRR